MSTAQAVNADHPIVIKVAINGANRKFKLPLRELNATTLPQKVWFTLLSLLSPVILTLAALGEGDMSTPPSANNN